MVLSSKTDMTHQHLAVFRNLFLYPWDLQLYQIVFPPDLRIPWPIERYRAHFFSAIKLVSLVEEL